MTYSLKRVAFELTLACNARCMHCGSSALHKRPKELTTHEAIRVIDETAGLGCEVFTFSGGEPLMRSDWPDLAEAVKSNGMRLELITNGLLLEEQAEAVMRTGFYTVGISVDGPPEIHDSLRGVKGGFDRIVKGVERLRGSGIHIGAVTQVGRINRPHLERLLALLEVNGFEGWQLQLTMPHGRAQENCDRLCLLPGELLALEQEIAQLILKAKILVVAGDNLGYFGRCEPLFRKGHSDAPKIWGGCGAGTTVIGICSDGMVKGCLSMPRTMGEGNVREQSLREIWDSADGFAYNRSKKDQPLTGPCATCALGNRCRAGCTSQAAAASGLVTENPMCIRGQLESDISNDTSSFCMS
jgi:radical SAM protein with 4Fe4S-binding SPASM domain